jgi:hypothetical protein
MLAKESLVSSNSFRHREDRVWSCVDGGCSCNVKVRD